MYGVGANSVILKITFYSLALSAAFTVFCGFESGGFLSWFITSWRVKAASEKVENYCAPIITSKLLLLLLCCIKGFSFHPNPKGRVPSYTVRNSAHLNRGANTVEALCLIAWYYYNMSILSGCWSPSTLLAGGTRFNWIPEKGKPSSVSWGNQNGALSFVYGNRELSLVLKSWLCVKAVRHAVFLCLIMDLIAVGSS